MSQTACCSGNDTCSIELAGGQRSVTRFRVGPLMAFIYINDFLPYLSHNKLRVFADDNSMSCRHRNIDQVKFDGEELLRNAEVLFTQNCLKLDKDKTHNIIFSSKSPWTTEPSREKLMGITLDT